MAHPLFKFQHPLVKQDFYVIWNTYSELPDTIPMDLTTFLTWYLTTNRSLEGLLYCWKDLQITGSSLNNMSFNDFNYKLKKMLYLLCENTTACRLEEKNRNTSDILMEFINGFDETQNPEAKLKQKLKEYNLALDRKSDYYYSYHHTQNWLKNRGIDFEFSNYYSDEFAVKYLDFFLDLFLHKDMPARFIPHLIRNEKAFREDLFSLNLQYLITDVSDEELSQLKEFKFTRKIPSFDELRKFLENTLYSDFGIANSLKEYLDKTGNTLDTMSNPDILDMFDELIYGNINYFYNFTDENGKERLPTSYLGDHINLSMEDNLVAITKFGIQDFDIFNLNGDAVLDVGVYDCSFFEKGYFAVQHHDLSVELYRRKDGLTEFVFALKMPIWQIRFPEFLEGKSFFNSGYVDENMKPLTPFCFDNGKDFKEGLAPVCLNGRWGFMNEKSEILIDFQYGDADAFENGYAKVFLLNDDKKERKGIWQKLETCSGQFPLSPDVFKEKYPSFPEYHYLPLKIAKNGFSNAYYDIETMSAYNFFANGIIESIDDNEQTVSEANIFGKWVVIDKTANIVFDNPENAEILSIQQDQVYLKINDETFVNDIKSENYETNPAFNNKDTLDKADKIYGKFNEIITEIENPYAYTSTDEYKKWQQKPKNYENRIDLPNQLQDGIPNELQKGQALFMLNYIAENGSDKISLCSAQLLENRRFLIAVLCLDGSCMKYLKEDLNDDFELALIAYKSQKFKSNIYASQRLLNDKEFAYTIAYLSKDNDYPILEYFSSLIKNDKDIVLKFVNANGRNLEFASEDLRKDKEVINLALKNTKSAIIYIHPEYSGLKEIWTTIDASVEKYIFNDLPDEILIDRDIIKRLLSMYPDGFRSIAFYYKDDDEICELVFKKNPELHTYFSERLAEIYKSQIPIFSSSSNDDDLPF